MQRFDPEKLDVDQAAVEFVVLADDVVENLPRGRVYLADQLQRASTSIPLNVAEGACCCGSCPCWLPWSDGTPDRARAQARVGARRRKQPVSPEIPQLRKDCTQLKRWTAINYYSYILQVLCSRYYARGIMLGDDSPSGGAFRGSFLRDTVATTLPGH